MLFLIDHTNLAYKPVRSVTLEGRLNSFSILEIISGSFRVLLQICFKPQTLIYLPAEPLTI